jgi:hypothetical protein
MGSFYTNITVRTADTDNVAAAVRQAGRTALIAPPENGATVVFDEASEEQDVEVLRALAQHLARACKCPALAILNHDDDVLVYLLYDAGKLVDEYNSAPGYFDADGDPDTPPSGGDADRNQAADGFLINGSVNNGAASPFAQLAAFGNNRRGGRSLYNGGIGLLLGNSAWDSRPFSFNSQPTRKPSYSDMQILGSFAGPLRIPGDVAHRREEDGGRRCRCTCLGRLRRTRDPGISTRRRVHGPANALRRVSGAIAAP